MTLLWDRGIRVSLPGSDLIVNGPDDENRTQLRVTAQVDLRSDPSQDTGMIQVYNLARATAERIYEKGTRVMLEAGYGGAYDLLFDCRLQRARNQRKENAWITSIEVSDKVRVISGEASSLGGTWEGSFNGPIAVAEIVRRIVEDGLGMRTGPLDAIEGITLNGTPAFYSADRPASTTLTHLLLRENCTWYADGNLIRVVRRGQGRPQRDSSTVMVNPDTGLIGRPTRTNDGEDNEGWEIQSLLLTQAKPEGIAVVDSQTVSGRFKVITVRHSIDNWQGPFHTYLSLRNLS